MLNDIYHSINPVALTIGDINIRWYGISYVVGAVIASLVFYRAARKMGKPVSLDWLLSLLIAVMLGVVIGGRFGYVLFYDFPSFVANPALLVAFNQGGMSFHGGLIGVLVAVVVFSQIDRRRSGKLTSADITGGVRPQPTMSLLSLADLIVIAAPWALLVVRVANFINGELWGSTTDLPWGVVFDDTGGGSEPRHPTQLYEALLEGLLLGVLMQIVLRHYVIARSNATKQSSKKSNSNGLLRPGQAQARNDISFAPGFFVSTFLIGYAIFRIAVEFVRQPDVQLGYLAGGWLTMGMLLSFMMLLAGIILQVVIFAKINRQKS